LKIFCQGRTVPLDTLGLGYATNMNRVFEAFFTLLKKNPELRLPVKTLQVRRIEDYNFDLTKIEVPFIVEPHGRAIF
jgi:hypothetical protein